MAAPSSPRRVLVVDDEEDLRTFVSLILKGVGYSVATASDGEEALQKIGAEPPDLVVLDLMMPVLDGWGVLERLRARGGPPPVVVVLSAYSDHNRAVSLGAAASVSKPFHVAELLVTCARAMAS